MTALFLSPLQDDKDQRERRFRREHLKLRERISFVLSAMPAFEVIGTSFRLLEMIQASTFRNYDLVALEVTVRQQAVHLLVAPERIWWNAGQHEQLLDLKRRARAISLRCVIMSAGFFKREPRLRNAITIARSAHTQVSVSQKLRIEQFVADQARAALHECAAIVAEHPDPFAAVLSLVPEGRLTIDLNRPITAYSELQLPARW